MEKSERTAAESGSRARKVAERASRSSIYAQDTGVLHAALRYWEISAGMGVEDAREEQPLRPRSHWSARSCLYFLFLNVATVRCELTGRFKKRALSGVSSEASTSQTRSNDNISVNVNMTTARGNY